MDKIQSIIKSSIDIKSAIISDTGLMMRISKSVEVIVDALKRGNKLLFCGNGGSAADAQHLAAEFSGRFYKDRIALPAEALHVNSSYLTAVANDYGFDVVYSRLIEGIGHEGDILIALSTSGKSINILKAIEMAKNKGLITICFTGLSGGVLRESTDILINVPSTETPRIQECHIMIGHIICQMVEEAMFV